ncbi:hypothetical protein EGR_10319 [Echinococcus granulosus]|uniref:Uncharacterized protein n=1 Tax=Echinococcus granulosus TaxID=6210 RepID=W6U8L5_ECHGR|nr:hypothetical protein EGR_10319 [Echinococcus granulosus]EUB54812.1 hypothetical protein EGR_10319 [Echinococcus granulosus]
MKSDGNAMEQKLGPSSNLSSTHSDSLGGHLRLRCYISDGQHGLLDMPVAHPFCAWECAVDARIRVDP